MKSLKQNQNKYILTALIFKRRFYGEETINDRRKR